ncbi:MAG: [FeFe] hydrogenase H-cluster radical SAM maturase HydE [Firmicutes bacterium]|nr:[FeFe] hydrogenase H-cluster radical SAM maturase HydE [Bacillota bacterium]
MDHDEILCWLLENDPLRLEMLWRAADLTRRLEVGDAVHLRGLIEVSNVCQRSCAYCGIAACAPKVERYRMTREDILECADRALEYGFGTVVMQAGEDPGITGPWMAEIIATLKQRTGLAITLSLGERSEDDLKAWRNAGADRYLLRFETTDDELYRRIHPPVGSSSSSSASDRIRQLERMRDLGYEIGTGVMVGIPGQTWETLTQDILAFRHYDMDMIGIGPYLPSPGTPLDGTLGETLRGEAGARQVPNDSLTTLKAVALTRLVCPRTNIPSTTALATADPSQGRANGLSRGANVIMPNLTQPRYRELYQIYPGKAGLHETADITVGRIREQIRLLGRTTGQGPGSSPRGKELS